jgi:hypothetical protein
MRFTATSAHAGSGSIFDAPQRAIAEALRAINPFPGHIISGSSTARMRLLACRYAGTPVGSPLNPNASNKPLEFVRSGFALAGPAVHLATSSEQHAMLSTLPSNRNGAILCQARRYRYCGSIRDDGAYPCICGIHRQWQFKDEACGALARHGSRNTSSSGVLEIALPGDALSIPGMNAAARRAVRSASPLP